MPSRAWYAIRELSSSKTTCQLNRHLFKVIRHCSSSWAPFLRKMNRLPSSFITLPCFLPSSFVVTWVTSSRSELSVFLHRLVGFSPLRHRRFRLETHRLLEELGVEYKLISYKRNESTNLAPPELKQVHPLGASYPDCDWRAV